MTSAIKKIPLKIKRLDNNPDLPLPAYESEGASAMDLRAAPEETVQLDPGDIRLIPTGIAVSLPRGYEIQIRPRSGLALKHGIGLVNTPGTIDSDYRGEIGLIMINWGKSPFVIHRGDRIAQMILCRSYWAEMTEVEELDRTARGEGGFGHSGVR